MQDFKNLSSNKKNQLGLSLSRTVNSNRKLASATESVSRKLSLPSGKHLEQLKHLLLFLAIVLALTPVCLLIFYKAPQTVTAASVWLRGKMSTPAPPRPPPPEKKPRAGSFEAACLQFDASAMMGDKYSKLTNSGDTLHYTIRGDLQKRVYDYLVANNVPFGVFVAIEPSSGRLLAMTAHSSVDKSWPSNAFFELYPMASLFKIITASAALENKRITPETVIQFRGRAYSENPRYWEASPKGKNNSMDVTHAMGKSVNPVYGRIAGDIAGKSSVMETVRRFGFNQPLFAGSPLKTSMVQEPATASDLKLMGAGLDHDVKISPLHAAMMMAAIANKGLMMAPSLTDRVVDGKGEVKETTSPQELRRLFSQETAASLTRMLSTTVTSGTSRKAFHDRRGRPRLNIDIAAKTGSINGSDPKGHYSWFAAFAPMQEPRIALVALVINQGKWKIKAPQVGQLALEEFFWR